MEGVFEPAEHACSRAVTEVDGFPLRQNENLVEKVVHLGTRL